jgi:hypothetical protein
VPGGEVAPVRTLSGHTDWVNALVLCNDDTLCTHKERGRGAPILAIEGADTQRERERETVPAPVRDRERRRTEAYTPVHGETECMCVWWLGVGVCMRELCRG